MKPASRIGERHRREVAVRAPALVAVGVLVVGMTGMAFGSHGATAGLLWAGAVTLGVAAFLVWYLVTVFEFFRSYGAHEALTDLYDAIHGRDS